MEKLNRLLIVLLAIMIPREVYPFGKDCIVAETAVKNYRFMNEVADVIKSIIRKTKRATPPERNVPKIKRNVRLKQNEAYHRCAFLLQPLLSHFSKNFRPTSPGSVG